MDKGKSKDTAKGIKAKKTKGTGKEQADKVITDEAKLDVPKIDPSEHNPRWDKRRGTNSTAVD
jgi:hypothetical protein